MAEIIVKINAIGETTVSVDGVKGTSCTNITKAIENALGGEILDAHNTLEYYEEEVAINVNIEE